MRYSAVAALLIVTTVLFSACSQTTMATLDDKSGNFYGRSAVANAQSNGSVFVPNFESHYVPPAAVDSVSTQELTPAKPALSAQGEPHSMIAQPVSPVVQPASISWQWPVQGPVTANFGKQREGIANEGITIAAAKNTPIHAAAAGQVAYVGSNVRDYGNLVILRHANGDMSSYAHAERITVSKGMNVKQGETLGYVGSSGNAKTPQLHFAVRSGDHAVDPLSKLPSQLASAN